MEGVDSETIGHSGEKRSTFILPLSLSFLYFLSSLSLCSFFFSLSLNVHCLALDTVKGIERTERRIHFLSDQMGIELRWFQVMGQEGQ